MSIKYSQEQLKNLSQKELITLIQTLTSEKKYGLVWEDFEEPTEEGEISVDILEKLCINLEAKDNIETKKHCIIEGDNLHSLKYLQEEFTNKVDVIYIDPPYNTGNEFVYNDKIVDKEDSFRHSKWLSFMSKRLKLAKKLLSEDGVIFVSIDDNEQAQLKLLMDEVFGEQNFMGNIIQDKGNAQNDAKKIQKNHEYIMVYGKDSTYSLGVLREPFHSTIALTREGDTYWHRGHNFTIGGEGGELKNRNNLGQVIYYKSGCPLVIQDDYDKIKAIYSDSEQEVYTYDTNLLQKGYLPIIPPKKQNRLGRWTWGMTTMLERIEEIGVNPSGNGIFQKKIVDSNDVRKEGNKYVIDTVAYNSPRSIQKFSTSDGTKEVTNIFGHKVFSNPKSTKLLKYLLSIYDGVNSKNATVLDFFAGSGTTGHAVMELNKEDGGNRKFILCTNNEVSEEKVRQHFIKQGLLDKNTKTAFNKFYKENEQLVNDFYNSEEYQQLGIARSVTYERLKRVIEGYTTPKGKEVEGIKDNSVLYLCATNKNKEENVK